MNRKERRKLKKQGIELPLDFNQDGVWHATSYSTYKRPKEEKPKPPVPGVDIAPIDIEHETMVDANIWFDRSRLGTFIETIKKLSFDPFMNGLNLRDMIKPIDEKEEKVESTWSWARNSDCKYINLRFDMRDGGFIMTNDKGKRISLNDLKWQWKSEEEIKNESAKSV